MKYHVSRARKKPCPHPALRVRMTVMAGLFLRLPLGDSAISGPGKARLLELIAETGSIRAAAAKMKISYRRAWLLLQEIEQIFGGPVLERQTGGKRRRRGPDPAGPRHRQALPRCRARAARAIKADLEALKKLKN